MLAFILDIHQTFEAHDLFIVALLVVLEGVLSIDNALVLGILAKRLPKHQQKKALTYGLIGAFVFRLLAIGLATFLIRLTIVKLLGGAYLLWIAIKHFFLESGDDTSIEAKAVAAGMIEEESVTAEQREHVTVVLQYQSSAAIMGPPGKVLARFWPTVFVIELTDVAFAVDSILAAIGVVGDAPPGTPEGVLHPKYWVVLTGGFLGVILMRFAAILFIRLLEAFPRFEEAAYILVSVIGIKLLLDWVAYQFHLPIDFHHPSSPAFWIFWIAMILGFCFGFLPEKKKVAQ